MVRHRGPPTLEQVESAASRLRPVERQILALSVRERMSNEEIAARLGMSVEAAERLLAAALCRLDREIERGGRPWWRFW